MLTFSVFSFLLIIIEQCIASTWCSSITVVSDEKVYVVSSNYNGYANFISADAAWYTISGVEWIWKSGQSVTTASFYKIFEIDNPSVGNILIYGDNTFDVYLNDLDTGCSCPSTNACFSSGGKNCDVSSYLISGVNVLMIPVTNTGGPGGLTFKLTIS